MCAGAFGCVYKAVLTMIPDSGDDSSRGEEEIPVAVKTIKSKFTDLASIPCMAI